MGQNSSPKVRQRNETSSALSGTAHQARRSLVKEKQPTDKLVSTGMTNKGEIQPSKVEASIKQDESIKVDV
jgi:hypothetical protein